MSTMTLQQALETAQQLQQAQKFPEAEGLCRHIIAQLPQCAPAWHLLGVVLCQAGDVANGLQAIQKSVELDPSPAFLSNYAAYLIHTGQLEAAIDVAQHAVLANSEFPDAWVNLGEAYRGAGRLDDAINAYRNVIRLRQDNPHHYNTLALRLHEAGRPAEAVEVFEEGVRRFPKEIPLISNLSLALKDTGRLTDAIEACKKTVSMMPKNPALYFNLAFTLMTAGRIPETMEAYRACMRLGDSSGMAHSSMILTMHCDENVSNAQLFAEHQKWARTHASQFSHSQPVTTPPHQKWRVGFMSADFYQHPVSTFLEPILQHHDRERFEFVLYSDVRRPDDVTRRLASHVSRYESMLGYTDEQMVKRVKEAEIDILVDLSGYTAYNRLHTFAQRAAPLQVSYLGYLNTTALPAMDYRLTDGIVDPPGESEQYYTEKLHRLPSIFACYHPLDGAPPVEDTPALKNGYVTFGYLGQLVKLNPRVIATWAQLLNQVPGSKLRIVTRGLGDAMVREDYWGRFERAGLARDRVVLEQDRPILDWLAAHHSVDILLDAWPFNNHTSSCHGLWMGAPVLTLAGDRYAARMGKSVLENLGLPELVAREPAEYVAIARKLSRDIDALQELRLGMRERMTVSPVMNAAAFIEDFQSALLQMWGSRL